MMSGSASAHLPIIIRLSSVAVFSAPLTDNPTNRSGKTDRADFSATCCGFFFVFCFLFFDIKNQCNFSLPVQEPSDSYFNQPAESKNLDLLVYYYYFFFKQDRPCGWWMYECGISHCGFWFVFLHV